jgi:hypothetical protein
MKKFILMILFIISFISIYSQNGNVDGIIFKDFGEWSMNVNNNKISVSAFITIEQKTKKLTSNEIKLNKHFIKKRNYDTINNYKITYVYRLYLKSNSIYNGDKTNTWIYGGKVYINGIEVTKEKFPDGFLIAVKTTPTLIYKYKTTSIKKINFYIKWDKAIYENRNINKN